MTVHPVNMMVMSTAGTGTGALELVPVTGWRTAADAAGTGEANPFWYTIRHTGAAEYEIGRGHVDAETGRLVRGQVVESSNGNAPVDFSEGVKEVTSSAPAQYLRAMGIDRSVTIDAATSTTVVDRLNSLLDLLQLMTPIAPIVGAIHTWTIPAGGLTEDLTDFPVDIYLNSTDSSDLFVGEDPWKNWKITCNQLQLYAEVVYCNGTNAHIVVKIPSITSAGAVVSIVYEEATTFEYTPESCSDDFTGEDGELPNKKLWLPQLSVNGTPLTPPKLLNNTLVMELTGVHVNSGDDGYISTTFKLVGDFNVSVAFSNLNTYSHTAAGGSIQIQDAAGNHALCKADTNGFFIRWHDGTTHDTTRSRTNTYGGFRIELVGNTVQLFCTDGSASEFLVTTGYLPAGEYVVRLCMYDWQSGSPVTCTFDNFRILSGTIVPPEVPHIEDQTAFIGETGSAPAKLVWDEHYAAVYHMAQDPSVGGACILDSTANRKNGTPSTVFSAAQLVVSKEKDGILFETGRSRINVPTIFAADVTDYTITTHIAPITLSNSVYPNLTGFGDWSAFVLCLTNTGTVFAGTGTTARVETEPGYIVADKSDHALAVSYKSGVCKLIKDDSLTHTVTGGPVPEWGTLLGNIGFSSPYEFLGTIYAVRFSKVARSDIWVKLENESLRGTLGIYSKTEAP